jgi:hypothetical protein
MICNSLTPHIYKTSLIPGYAIMINLLFKHDFKFYIISIYLPSNNAFIRLQTQNTIIQWLQDASTLNLLPIMLGDFNASTNNIHSSSIKHKLLQLNINFSNSLPTIICTILLHTLLHPPLPGTALDIAVKLTLSGPIILL